MRTITTFPINETTGNSVAKAKQPAPHATEMLGAWLPAHVSTLSGILDELATAKKGNSLPSEKILAAQAVTLDALYHSILKRVEQYGGHPDVLDRFVRLGLKAQNQCRATLVALEEVRNPRPIAYVGQANIAAGAQQVINEVAGEKITTEILEHADAEK